MALCLLHLLIKHKQIQQGDRMHTVGLRLLFKLPFYNGDQLQKGTMNKGCQTFKELSHHEVQLDNTVGNIGGTPERMWALYTLDQAKNSGSAQVWYIQLKQELTHSVLCGSIEKIDVASEQLKLL